MPAGNVPMQVDGQQQPCTTDSDREQEDHSTHACDLTQKEGVGRCYYTQLPRLVKVSKAYSRMVAFLFQCLGVPCDVVYTDFTGLSCVLQINQVSHGVSLSRHVGCVV